MNAPLSRPLTRRQFIRSTGAAAALATTAPMTMRGEQAGSFTFALLGDLHFDRPDHHDMKWLEQNKPGDVGQIRNYSRITADITPKLLASVAESVAANKGSFVLQVGDLVEGLCGSAELAAKQNREALAFIRDARLGAPFIFTKGNHDVTGTGANEAFDATFLPFLDEQTSSFTHGARRSSANFAIDHSGALFCCFDAYDKNSLEWLEAALARRTAQHCFVVIHPPVVPYGARSTWYLYSSEKEKSRREHLLALLGKQNAFVLGGHIHKFSAIARDTPGGGRFVQLAVSSIVNAPEVKAKDLLSSVAQYNGDQIRVEPSYSSATAEERRSVYTAEQPFVKSFEYADLPGHAVVTVAPDRVSADIFSGISRQKWKTVDLTAALRG